MPYKKKFIKLSKLYIIFFSFILFINLNLINSLKANTFQIKNLEITEPFDLNFNKEKVMNKGFKQAFEELASMITTSGDKKLIKNPSISTIKSLIDSFTVSNETFINNKYQTKFDVNFNKKNTLFFFEKKGIFPSIPIKKNLLLIPVLVDLDLNQVYLFNKNIFYEKWNDQNERYYLLNYILPSEDLEDVNFILKNTDKIEDYDFTEIVNKYDLDNYIIVIIYKNNDNLRILSKVKLNENYKIDNKKFDKKNLLKDKDFKFITNTLKNSYENQWKVINQINTSIKVPLTVAISSKEYEKIKVFENNLNKFNFVSSFGVLKFDNKNIYYKITYNGSPRKFINQMNLNKILIVKQNQIWVVQ